MKLEPGKKYKTRDGLIAEVYAIKEENKENRVALGAIQDSDGWETFDWCINGEYLLDGENDEDIVSEYSEPLKFECDVEWCESGLNQNVYPSSVLPYHPEWKALVGKRGRLTFEEFKK